MAKKSPKSTKSEKIKEKGGDKVRSLADLYDDADPAEASNLLSVGEHKVRLNKLEYKKDPKKGEAVRAEFEALTGDEEGKKISQLYKLRDADGGKGPGLVYLKRDLALLGHEDVEGKKLLKTLEKISEEQPMVIVRVSKNGMYVNAFLQGLAEDADDEGGEDAEELEVGDKVTGTNDDGDEITGEIVKIKKGKATVKDDDDDEHVIALDDLEKADEEEEEEEEEKPKKGSKKKKGEEEEEEDDEKPKKGSKKKKKDEEEEEEEEEEAELEVGDKVKGENDDGDDIEGEIIKIKGENATVKDEDGDKHTCALSDLEKVDDEEEEEEEKEIEVGDRVKWEDDDGDPVEGEVKKIKGDKLLVEDDDGDEHKVDKDDAEIVEED